MKGWVGRDGDKFKFLLIIIGSVGWENMFYCCKKDKSGIKFEEIYVLEILFWLLMIMF